MNFSVEDIANVVRLVREALDFWDTPLGWRERLLRSACALLQGSAGSMHGVEARGECYRVHPLAVVELFRSETALDPNSKGLVCGPEVEGLEFRVMPEFNKLYKAFEEVGWATATHNHLHEAALFGSQKYDELHKTLESGEYLLSLRKVDVPQRASLIEIDRPRGAKPFTPREVALLELLHSEIAPLIGVRLTTEEHLSRDGLSRRLNQTLSLLLEGCSEKEAADKLKISPRTVHDYVTMLYKHFSVNSRAELLAYFIHRRPEKRVASPGLRTA